MSIRLAPLALGFILAANLAPAAGPPAAPRLAANTPGNLSALVAEPAALSLRHAGDLHQVLTSATLGDGSVHDLTRTASYALDDPSVASVSPTGVVRPLKAGKTTLRLAAGGKTTAVAVTVESTAPHPVSFARDIMPVLARAGCNAGACHGAASGKKGFKVSLWGYDPATDYLTLTRGSSGRRLDRLDPARSLLVLKPTGRTPHEGGKRFEPDSESAQLLARWITEGATSDLATAPKPTSLEVLPSFRTYAHRGQEQQLLVRATFSDGSVRDVTRWARYSSSNELSALPSEHGLVRLPAKGEAAVMVRYGPLIAVSNLTVLEHDPSFRWASPPENNYIDRLVFAKLKQIEVQPSDLCTDEEFLRRLSYDLTGLPPTPAEVRAFLADRNPDKRTRKIDELLDRPDHAEFWASKWADLFRLRFDLTGDRGTWGMYRWLRDSVAGNKPFDRLVRELVTADGDTGKNAPATFWRVFATPEESAETVAQVFLGTRLLCARCHDHPFEKWVQKDYYGLSAFFSQVGRKPGLRQGEQVIFRQETRASARHPVTGETLAPKYLAGLSISVSEKEDARALLADWLTRKDNPFLARATVNRLWSQLFGRGIIDPVDDIRSSNPPSNPELLEALSKDFLDHDFDVRHVLRTIARSRVYQLSARTNPSNASDRINFSHASPRRLAAEQILDTLTQITGIKENFRSRIPGAGTVALPAGGVRAGALPDRLLTTDILDLFGRPKGESSCTCERSEEASLTQALQLINGKAVSARLADANGNLAKLVKTPGLTPEKLAEELYLLALCRLPGPAEQKLVLEHLAKNDRFLAAQDVLWALLNTREFLFNH